VNANKSQKKNSSHRFSSVVKENTFDFTCAVIKCVTLSDCSWQFYNSWSAILYLEQIQTFDHVYCPMTHSTGSSVPGFCSPLDGAPSIRGKRWSLMRGNKRALIYFNHSLMFCYMFTGLENPLYYVVSM